MVYEIRSYLNDRSPNRYTELVDRLLLASPDHASQMAAVWRSFLIPDGVDLTAFGGAPNRLIGGSPNVSRKISRYYQTVANC